MGKRFSQLISLATREREKQRSYSDERGMIHTAAWEAYMEPFPSTSMGFLMSDLVISKGKCQECHLYSTHETQFKTNCIASTAPLQRHIPSWRRRNRRLDSLGKSSVHLCLRIVHASSILGNVSHRSQISSDRPGTVTVRFGRKK